VHHSGFEQIPHPFSQHSTTARDRSRIRALTTREDSVCPSRGLTGGERHTIRCTP